MRRRHISWIAAAVATLAVALGAVEAWRQQAVPRMPLLPVAFEHSDHREEPCAECHHNFLDGTGGGTCYGCHKADPEINYQMETMFHEYCEGCHVEKQMEGEESGPLRECSGCHVDPPGAQSGRTI